MTGVFLYFIICCGVKLGFKEEKQKKNHEKTCTVCAEYHTTPVMTYNSL
uniref:Uncharacterized protein n=1 Tax=Anguilla anguilla TaxID=7936 RepID=A0A0E9WJI5_ANGAN